MTDRRNADIIGVNHEIRRLRMKKILSVMAGLIRKAAGMALSLLEKGVSLGLSAARSAAAAAGCLTARLTGRAARCVGGKLKKRLTPALKGVMIVSASVAVLSCVGWLVSRKD